MGQFIKFGLCTKISCPQKEKSKIDKYYKSFDQFFADFENKSHINIKLFNFYEEDDNYIFTIKDELLKPDGLTYFLKDFFADIYDEKDLKVYCDAIYENIKDKNSVDELIKFATKKRHQNFQLTKSQCCLTSQFVEHIYIEYEYIVLFLNGKAYMECYDELFSYMEKMIRFRHTHPQAWAMKVFID